MFPSANYFRDIPCPFFSRVSCPRPHCHFKHAQISSQSTINSNASSSSSIHIPPDANETLNKLISQLSSAAAANTPTTTTTATAATNPTPSVDFTSILQSTLLQSLSTVLANAALTVPPQTTTSNSTKNDVTEKSQSTTNTVETIPEYRPTPIAELERRKRMQQLAKPDTKTNFNSDEYVQATFSPPSSSPPSPAAVIKSESIEESKSKTSTISKPTPPTFTDDNHSWVTPPARQKFSSSDSDDRNSSPIKRLTSFEKAQPPVKKPTATVKPNVIDKPTRTAAASTTNPLLKPIPKKPTPTKVRVSDIDLKKVPVTSTISLDIDSPKPVTALKRTSTGPNEIPQKKAKLTTTTSTAQVTKKKVSVTSNGTTKSTAVDAELALFDQAFSNAKSSSPSVARPPNAIQQLSSRYSSQTSVSTESTSPSSIRTRAETSTDGRRIAHQPKAQSNANNTSSTSFTQPLVDPNSSINKIPFKTRQEYLTFFLNELKKKSSNVTHLSRAQMIEKEIFDKSTNKNTYLNLAAKHLRQLRSEEAGEKTIAQPIVPKKVNPQRLVVSHSAMLTTGDTENVSFGIKQKKEIDFKSLTENELYTFLLVYKASERDLTENGYPAFSLDFPDKVLIKNKNPLYNSSAKLSSSDPFTRICCRCGKTYKLNQDGEYIKKEQCIHHWGRTVSQRIAGQIEKTYSCCSSKTNTVGCAVAPCHVHEANESQLLSGYVKTQPLKKTLAPNESFGIYALDCEMCYTINGLELVRVSVIDHKLQSVFETLVKPRAEILDYNTRWSGITEEHLRNCQVTIQDVQRRLLKLFNNKTILIGHSLESDLKALKIVHETVVDTSLVFPHAKGKPFKRALKNLMSEYLHKIIQENAEGHDSLEDAVAAIELMLWKVKQDLKHR